MLEDLNAKNKLFEEAGITDKLIFQKLKERLCAKKKIRDKYGEIIDSEDDGAAIDAALEKILKMKGFLAEDKTIINVATINTEMGQAILKASREAVKKSIKEVVNEK